MRLHNQNRLAGIYISTKVVKNKIPKTTALFSNPDMIYSIFECFPKIFVSNIYSIIDLKGPSCSLVKNLRVSYISFPRTRSIKIRLFSKYSSILSQKLRFLRTCKLHYLLTWGTILHVPPKDHLLYSSFANLRCNKNTLFDLFLLNSNEHQT